MDSVLLRIEHLYQPRDKMGSPQNIQLGKSKPTKKLVILYIILKVDKPKKKLIYKLRSFTQWLYGS